MATETVRECGEVSSDYRCRKETGGDREEKSMPGDSGDAFTMESSTGLTSVSQTRDREIY